MKKTPVVVCIDVEPDERLILPKHKKDWRGFELSCEFFSELRPRLEAVTGSPVRFCWFFRMDPQVEFVYGTANWVVERYPSLINRIRDAGDGLGLHVHAWRWEVNSQRWIADYRDQSWVDHCVRVGFESFRKSFKQPCSYFRFGDHWMNNHTLDLIHKLGARFDLTLEPGQKNGQAQDGYTGSFIDCTEVPRNPYRPSEVDFRKPDSAPRRDLWVVPLSSGAADWSPASSYSELSKVRQQETTAIDSDLSFLLPTYEGCLDRADGRFIAGWAYDQTRPNQALEVAIYDNDVLLTTATASIFRRDLLAAGKGNGKHCFNVVTPSCLKDGRHHRIRVKVARTSFHLNNSPHDLAWGETDYFAQHMTLNLSYDSWPMCRLIDALLHSPTVHNLALVVRSDVITRADQRSNMEQTLGHLLSHPEIRNLGFQTPIEMMNGRE